MMDKQAVQGVVVSLTSHLHTVGNSNLFEKKRQLATGGGWIEVFKKNRILGNSSMNVQLSTTAI